MKLAAPTLAALLVPAVASAAQATWYLQYADRSGMVAISSDVVKEGMSGAYTTWLFVNPEPAPSKPNVVDYKIEFDCISKRFRFDGGVVSNFGSQPRSDMTGSDWETPAVGSQLEQDVVYACKGKVPMSWVNERLSIDDLIEFYYTKILGIPEPKPWLSANLYDKATTNCALENNPFQIVMAQGRCASWRMTAKGRAHVPALSRKLPLTPVIPAGALVRARRAGT